MARQTVRVTDNRLASAWYVHYPLDAYALGPLRFNEPVTAAAAADKAERLFCERPKEVWPEGPTEETDEYEYEVQECT